MNTHHLLKECLGWTATAAFAASYLCRSQNALRAVQAVAAVLWIAYGVATGSLPVIASNTAVAFMAVIYPLIRQAARAPADLYAHQMSKGTPKRRPSRNCPTFSEFPAGSVRRWLPSRVNRGEHARRLGRQYFYPVTINPFPSGQRPLMDCRRA